MKPLPPAVRAEIEEINKRGVGSTVWTEDLERIARTTAREAARIADKHIGKATTASGVSHSNCIRAVSEDIRKAFGLEDEK